MRGQKLLGMVARGFWPAAPGTPRPYAAPLKIDPPQIILLENLEGQGKVDRHGRLDNRQRFEEAQPRLGLRKIAKLLDISGYS